MAAFDQHNIAGEIGCGAASDASSMPATSIASSANVVITYDDSACQSAAEKLALKLGVPECVSASDVSPQQLALRVTADGLVLARDNMKLKADFTHMLSRIRSGAIQRELLVKAARIKGVDSPTAIDATAGLGEDGLLLAAAGFSVILCEANPVIAALLRDAVDRALHDTQLKHIAERMHVMCTDSKSYLRACSSSGEQTPDVVYLDPMFPERSKSAAVKKKFQLIHGLEIPCLPEEEEQLLQAAFEAQPKKIVVKRPVKGPVLAGIKPSYSLSGKAVRYDCIVPAER